MGDDLIDSGMSRCVYDENWSKIFTLSDFGIGPDEQFHITKGEVGVMKSEEGVTLNFGVYRIDENFPEAEPWLIGGSWTYLPAIDSPEIVTFTLQNSIVVPAGTERIMLVVGRNYGGNPEEFQIAGTQEDTSDSWFLGCREYYDYILTSELENPVPDANFYITAIGETFSINNSGATTTLNHSTCDELTDPPTIGCSWGGMSWSRDFYLEDFGISSGEEFIIESGQVGLASAGWGVKIQFRIFEIDDNFPESFSEDNLIAESREVDVGYFDSRHNKLAKIFDVQFENAIRIPADVERILVMVYQTEDDAFPASTVQDDGSISWFKTYAGGCRPQQFTDVRDLGWPDVKLYINVTGSVTNSNNSFGMNYTNICTEFLKEFSLTNQEEIAAVSWDFGDPASGADNNSTDLSPFHDFSEDGQYTITATVIGRDGTTEVISESIDVQEPPEAYGIENIEACENEEGSGYSTSFDTSGIKAQVLRGQTGKVVSFTDGSGNEYETLPNPFSNTIAGRETIKVKVASINNLCCFDETSFDLIVNPLPDFSEVDDVYVCDSDSDGHSVFDLTPIYEDFSINDSEIGFYRQDGEKIQQSQLNAVTNNLENQEVISLRITNIETGCSNETEFKLISVEQPIANELDAITACDDNKDGISEFFDTSAVEDLVLGNQEGVQVSYYLERGEELPNPLPNPYTNSQPEQEIITVRVTNLDSGCFAETTLELLTSSQPKINRPEDLYACDSGGGFAFFDTAALENQLIGDQAGLFVIYKDEDGNTLPSPLPENYQNKKAWRETIFVRVESESNAICYSETSFDLVVNELPEIELEEEYFLCDLEPFLHLEVSQKFDSWQWTDQNGTVISNSNEAELIEEGAYTLTVTETRNSILCENSFSFFLIRSVLPSIDEVKIRDISENNFIEIITSGDGQFEYSIDGINYQDSSTFFDVPGGVHAVEVRDKNGCGSDRKEVVLVDYPDLFTPNNDGYNDFWHIEGISKFPQSKILIYDRYGKLMKELSPKDHGWDGNFNGRQMPSNDYWFTVYLDDGRSFNGHFSLLR